MWWGECRGEGLGSWVIWVVGELRGGGGDDGRVKGLVKWVWSKF